MVHIHGTPIGGTRVDVERFLAGRHALVPFPRQDDIAVVAAYCSSFVLDNGAYTIWRQGGKMDYDGYVNWVEKWHRHPGFDWAVIPDVIGGTEQENDEMLEIWPSNLRGIPVYHLDESIDRLLRLANTYDFIAFGSSAKFKKRSQFWNRMEEVMDAICDEEGRPICKIHGLRMLDHRIFTRLPLTSADSTNATRNSNNFEIVNSPYPQPTRSQRTDAIANTIEAHNSAPVWVRAKQIKIF